MLFIENGLIPYQLKITLVCGQYSIRVGIFSEKDSLYGSMIEEPIRMLIS